MKLQHVLDSKPPQEIISVSPDCTVAEATHTMCERHVGALVVMEPDEKTMVGIVSERDLLRHLCAQCNDPATAATRTVREIMTRDVVVASPDDHVQHAMSIMSKHHIRHLPIVDKTRVVGMISIGDLLSELYAQDELKIQHLNDFLGGTYGLRVY